MFKNNLDCIFEEYRDVKVYGRLANNEIVLEIRL